MRRAFHRAVERLGNLPLQVKGLIVLAIPLFGLLLVSTALYLTQRDGQSAQQRIAHTVAVRSQIQKTQSLAEQAETGALGYLSTHDPAWRQTYLEARRSLPGTLVGLESMVAGNPDQLAGTRRLANLVERRLAVLDSAVAGAPPAQLDSPAAPEAIRAELRGLLSHEDQVLERWRARAGRVEKRGYAAIAVGFLFAPAGGILAMLLFAGGVAKRERSLRSDASLLETRVDERTAELLESQEALAESNRRLRAIIDASPLAIMRFDTDGNIQRWNHAAERILGWQAGEVLNRPLPGEGSPPEWLARVTAGEEITALETSQQRKDGTLIKASVWATPLRSAGGEIRGAMAVLADSTAQRRLEQQLAQAQKMEAIGRLAGGAAHDFNNLITVVAGYGQMLREGVGDKPLLREAAEEILHASDRAAALAGQLLVFSRRKAIQPRILDLNELITDVKRMLTRVLGEDVELRTQLSPTLGMVKADPGQLEQVIVNLALNARDAMPSGGKLTIETANADLGADYARSYGISPGPYVMLAVSDTGCGMTSDVKGHLFEPFFTTKERGMGTGLGLSTVYGIVKQHGGDIWVYSEPDRGTTLKIYLPRTTEAATAEEMMMPESLPSGTETVLVVEDEEGVRRLIRDVLELQGYTVLEAASGESALERTEGFPHIDLLVTDVVMPKMSGRDLAEALKLLRPEIKVLFLSGYTDRAVVEHGVGASDNFLQKPFTPVALARAVRQVLDRPARASCHGQ
jgi:PAS domain S-box-containing protein